MRKAIFMLTLMLATTTATKAQKNGGYAKGDKLLNIGLGVNSYYSGGIPFGFSFEKGISDAISVGGNFDYLSSKFVYSKFTVMYFGARASYHLNEALNINDEKVDLYAGAALGFRSFKWNDDLDTYDSYASALYLGVFIGGKYYFSKKTAAFLEAGAIGSTNARIGVAFKF